MNVERVVRARDAGGRRLAWRIACAALVGCWVLGCKGSSTTEPRKVLRATLGASTNDRGDAEARVTVTVPAGTRVQATMPIKQGSLYGDGSATEVSGQCETTGTQGETSCVISLPFEVFGGEGPFELTFVTATTAGKIEATTTQSLSLENVAIADRLLLKCMGGLTCTVDADGDDLVLQVTSKTAPVTVTLAGKSASAEAGKPARAAVPLAAVFAAEDSDVLMSTSTKYTKVAATIAVAGRTIFDGKVTARPGDLVRAINHALTETPPRAIGYHKAPTTAARRAVLMMPLVRAATRSAPDTQLLLAGARATVDEVDVFITTESSNVRTIKCGRYQSKDGSKHADLEAQVWETKIHAIERATGKVLATKTAIGGGCSESVLEGAQSADGEGVSIRGREVRELAKTLIE